MESTVELYQTAADAEARHPASSDEAWKEAHFAGFVSPQLAMYWEASETPARRVAEAYSGILLDDGSLVFIMQRDHLSAVRRGTGLKVGEFAMACQEPLARWQVSFKGRGRHYPEPSMLIHGGEHRDVAVTFNLELSAIHPAVGLAGGQSPGRYEQPVRVTGEIRIGEQSFELACAGIRDHTWGARTWLPDKRWTWLAGFSDDGPCFTLMSSSVAGADQSYGWFSLPGCPPSAVSNIRIGSWDPTGREATHLPAVSFRWNGITIRLEPDVDASRLPLRHREGGLVSDILEVFTQWNVTGAGTAARVPGLLERLDVRAQPRQKDPKHG